MSRYQSTKTYGPEVGLSCCFRQPNANSHCSKLHGYALSFKFTFAAEELDARNWVADFGAFKWLKEQLQFYFDHTVCVAMDDPHYYDIVKLSDKGIAAVIALPAVGCEAFAKFACDLAERALKRDVNLAPRVRVISCECAEHGANSAIYFNDK